jgi:DNA-binding NtrC family response regulator
MKNIVVVEDNITLLNVLENELEDFFNVNAFSQPKEALEYIKKNHSSIDIVMTDFMMPGMDGLELLKATTEINTKIVKILLTGYCKDVEEKQEKIICNLILDKNIMTNNDELIGEINRASVK